MKNENKTIHKFSSAKTIVHGKSAFLNFSTTLLSKETPEIFGTPHTNPRFDLQAGNGHTKVQGVSKTKNF